MLTAIVQHSADLVAFITALNIALYQPQIRHLIQMVDALITSNETKTISGLYRLLKGQSDQILVANHLQKASCVSLQSALAFYGLIPEFVTSTTSVSTGRPERVDTPLGIFEFRHLRTDLLFGYRMIDLDGQNALVATPEKALLDLLYLQPGGDSTAYLNELRLQNTEQLDIELLRKQSEKFGTAKLLKAAKVISRMIAGKKDEFEDL